MILAALPTLIVGASSPIIVRGAIEMVLIIFSKSTYFDNDVFSTPKADSKPIIPNLARSNSFFFDSISSGVWSETITSIVPSFIPLINALMSFFERSGGAL